jgi:hypothetical protein
VRYFAVLLLLDLVLAGYLWFVFFPKQGATLQLSLRFEPDAMQGGSFFLLKPFARGRCNF